MITDIIAGFLSGIAGAMGLGGGGILILYLTLFRDIPQLHAQGINLLFFIPSAVAALIKHNKNNLVEWKISKNYIFYGIVGLVIGYGIISVLNQDVIRKIFAIILMSTGIKELFFKNKKRG